MSSVSPETSSVCLSSRRYSGVISEGDSIRSPFLSSWSKVGFTVAMAYLRTSLAGPSIDDGRVGGGGETTSVSVIIVDDRRFICNRAVEALGPPAKLPVVGQERCFCRGANPAPGKQRVRQIRIAEREAPELVGEQEAAPEGFAVVESVRLGQRWPGPFEELRVKISDLVEVPGTRHHLR